MSALTQFYHKKFSGLLAVSIIALASVFLSEHYGGPTMLFALLLGIALNFLSDHERCKEGIDLTAKNILRIGVAFLGLRISFDAIGDLGLGPVALVIIAVLSTMIFGFFLSRFFNTTPGFGCLTGGSVGICGASAAMAISSVLPQGPERERETIFTVITVTAFSTIAMVLYPLIASALGMSEQQTGIFLGATIHDVAQVVGAGYGVSDSTGDTATVIKLLRVAMLLPVVFSVMLIIRFRFNTCQGGQAKLPFPWFVLGFVSLVVLNSTVEIPAPVCDFFVGVSRWCIIGAVAALGMKTSFGALVKVGFVPVFIIFAETAFIAVLAIGFIFACGL